MHTPHSYQIFSRYIFFAGPGGGIGRRKGLKIPRAISCRFDSGPGHMKFLTFFFLTFLLVSCGNIKSPSIISPDLNLKMVSDGDYGSIPLTYTKILKKYLIKELNDHKETKIEFVNEPQRLSIEHLGDTYSGFRVCLSINEKKDGYYRGWRNHFYDQ